MNTSERIHLSFNSEESPPERSIGGIWISPGLESAGASGAVVSSVG